MTDQRIAEITARCEAATPGPWKVIEKGNTVPSFAVVSVAYDTKPQEMICPNMSTKTGNADFIAHAREDIPFLLAEIDRLTEALEAVKRGNVDCASAEHEADGKCLGYGRGENDDEPCEQCANCHKCTAYEAETKTIQEWAALDGIRVYDPDGFDCTDPLLWEREITKAEYVAGIMRCTVMPLPAAPEKGARP